MSGNVGRLIVFFYSWQLFHNYVWFVLSSSIHLFTLWTRYIKWWYVFSSGRVSLFVFVGVLVLGSGSIPVHALSVKNCSMKYLCLFWSNGFVYMSARFSSVGTYSILMSPLVTYPLTKWYRRAMCLLPLTNLLFLIVSMAGWLSHNIVGSSRWAYPIPPGVFF